MARTILVPKEAGGEIHVTEGTLSPSHIDALHEKYLGTVYQVTGGEIVVEDRHINAILLSVPGATLKPEPPAKEKHGAPSRQ